MFSSLAPLVTRFCGKCRSCVGETKLGIAEYFHQGREFCSLESHLSGEECEVVLLPEVQGDEEQLFSCWTAGRMLGQEVLEGHRSWSSRIKLTADEASRMSSRGLWCSPEAEIPLDKHRGASRSSEGVELCFRISFSVDSRFLCHLKLDRRAIFVTINKKCQHQQWFVQVVVAGSNSLWTGHYKETCCLERGAGPTAASRVPCAWAEGFSAAWGRLLVAFWQLLNTNFISVIVQKIMCLSHRVLPPDNSM